MLTNRATRLEVSHGVIRHVRYSFLLVCYAIVTLSLRRTIFEIFDLTLEPVSLKVIGIHTDRSTAYEFLLAFHSNLGPISYRFRDKCRF